MDEPRWFLFSEVIPAGWRIGAVDHQNSKVWASPPGWTAPAPDLKQPWPGRPSDEVPRAKYRTDGTVESAGYNPGGTGSAKDASKWVEAELPWVWVPMGWVKTLAELEQLIAPARAKLTT
jgi:hypothetical protein